jgi:hypothetical protein
MPLLNEWSPRQRFCPFTEITGHPDELFKRALTPLCRTVVRGSERKDTESILIETGFLESESFHCIARAKGENLEYEILESGAIRYRDRGGAARLDLCSAKRAPQDRIRD